MEREIRSKIRIATSVSAIASEASPSASPSIRDYSLSTPLPFELVPLSLSQRLRLGLANALMLVFLVGLLLIIFQLWSLWPMLAVMVGVAVLMPIVYEILPLPWGILRGIVWGGIFAVLWYGMSQFVWLIPPDIARRWALVVLAASTWIGRGIYRPWHSLTWETVIGLGVCLVIAATAFL